MKFAGRITARHFYSHVSQTSSWFKLTFIVTLLLQANRLRRWASHPKLLLVINWKYPETYMKYIIVIHLHQIKYASAVIIWKTNVTTVKKIFLEQIVKKNKGSSKSVWNIKLQNPRTISGALFQMKKTYIQSLYLN